ncbi:DNA binding protein [Melia azedarach]|uniref:DNA binding protein n=1 Tax=Melia azedarach TaxID=155640 RepID=A0ACC1YEH8_MELAZ|nr:DNA binding protein [Melia azedarach]
MQQQAEKLRRNMKREQQSECGVCGCSDKLLLHNVRHRGTYRRFCSNCILKAHQGLFCPICLQVYDGSPPPPHVRVMCVKCPSICHLSCVSSSSATTSSSFLCPPCSSPNFSFFNFNNKKVKVNGDGNSNDTNDDEKRIDVGSAKALVAAAKIAASSMSKAAAVARVEAERRVKEAALAKKRAREALEKLLYLAAEEKKGKSVRPRIGAEGNNNGGDKGSNGLYSQHQQNNRGMGN